jgi:hypothetical protein
MLAGSHWGEELSDRRAEPRAFRKGAKVRVRPGYRSPELDGLLGVIIKRWGAPEHPAFDVRLEDGRERLFWFYELEGPDGISGG